VVVAGERGRGGGLVDDLAEGARGRAVEVAVAVVLGGDRVAADREGRARVGRLAQGVDRVGGQHGQAVTEGDRAARAAGARAVDRDRGRQGHALAEDRRVVVAGERGRGGGLVDDLAEGARGRAVEVAVAVVLGGDRVAADREGRARVGRLAQ